MFGRLFASGEKDRAISVAVLVKGAHEFSAVELTQRLRGRGIKAERGEDAPRQSLGMKFNDIPMMLVPEFPAVPPGQLLELGEAAWWWPEAHERCRDHTHVVAIGVPEGRGDKVERRRVASEVALAVARMHASPAILWRDAEALHEPDAFARALDAEETMARAWISVRVAELAGTKFFFTTGCEAFGHRELEMNVPPRESVDQAHLLQDLLGWAIRHGTRIAPGTTIGRTPEERLTVSIEGSRIPGRRDVVRLNW